MAASWVTFLDENFRGDLGIGKRRILGNVSHYMILWNCSHAVFSAIPFPTTWDGAKTIVNHGRNYIPSAPPVVCIGCCAEKALRPLFRDITLRSHRIFWKSYVLRRWTARFPIESFCWKHGKPGTCRTCMDDEFCEVLPFNEWRFGWSYAYFWSLTPFLTRYLRYPFARYQWRKTTGRHGPFCHLVGSWLIWTTGRSCTQVAIL